MLISFGTLVIIYWSCEVEIGEDRVARALFSNESLKDGTRGTRDTSQLERVQDSSADGW